MAEHANQLLIGRANVELDSGWFLKDVVRDVEGKNTALIMHLYG